MHAPTAARNALHLWTAHPASERPAITAAATMVVLMLSLAAGMTAGSLAWSVLAIFLLVLALRRFYLRSHHRVDETGVTAHHLLGSRFLPWSRIQRVVADERGGFVGTTRHRSRLDHIRGIHLLFPISMESAERERIVETLRANAGIVDASQRDAHATTSPVRATEALS